MLKKIIFIVIALAMINIFLFPMYRAPEAGRYYYWLFSPDLLSRGMGVGGTENPSGTVINPASNSFNQRFRVELSYGISPAFWAGNDKYYTNEKFVDAGDAFLPFIINTGLMIPSKYGNFTIYANYMNMSNLGFGTGNNNDLGIGKIGSLYFDYSKDYDNVFGFGFGGNVKVSWNPLGDKTKLGVGGGLDAGLVIKPEWNFSFSKKIQTGWGAQDFEFAFTLKDLGMFLFNFTSTDQNGNEVWGWFPPPFTPSAGFSLNLYNDGNTYWKLMTDMSAPFFQNLTVAAGTELQIYKFLVLRGSYTFDLEGVLEYTGVIPQYEKMYSLANTSFGVSFRFKSGFTKKQTKAEEIQSRYKTNEFSIDLGAKPFSQGFIIEAGLVITIGAKDFTPPDISYVQNDYYISPNNDGIQDKLTVSKVKMTDKRYVAAWKLEIYDGNENIVRTIANKQEKKENLKFADVVKKYFSPKAGVFVPKEIIWDGRNDMGQVVPDGDYTFKFIAADDNKNINDKSDKGEVVVKTDKPEMKADLTNKIFSPNGDSSKEALIIDYNIIKDKVENIFIKLEDINKELSREKINVPEVKKELKEIKTVNVESKFDYDQTHKQLWLIEILDSSNKVIKSYQFDKKGTGKIEWDGTDQSGAKMPDGVYKMKLHSTDLAGNSFEEIIPNIVIDTQSRPIEVRNLSGIFSPNGDGVKDKIEFSDNVPITRGIESWKFEIINDKNQIVNTSKGQGLPPVKLDWDGKNEDNKYSSEGKYKGRLTAGYINGNMPFGETPFFNIDITPPYVNVRISPQIFSPGLGNIDEVALFHENPTKKAEWNGTIYNETGEKVKSFIWHDTPPEKLMWNGKDENNRLLPDGLYYYRVEAMDEAGNYSETEKFDLKNKSNYKNQVRIFTQYTPVTISSMKESFNPKSSNQSYNHETFEIKAEIAKVNKVNNWIFDIFDSSNNKVFTLANKGDLPQNIEWNGLAADKKAEPDGIYTGKITVNFIAGTVSNGKTREFSIDTIPPSLNTHLSTDIFSPGSGKKDFVIIYHDNPTKENDWSGFIFDESGNRVKKFTWKDFPDKEINWDGKDDNNRLLPDGIYYYQATAIDKAGNSFESEKLDLKNLSQFKNHARIFTKDTPVSVSALLESFNPDSKEAKYNHQTFSLKSNTYNENKISDWKLEVRDSKNKVVYKTENTGDLLLITGWNGKTDNNKNASDGIYTALLSVNYNAGTSSKSETREFEIDSIPPSLNTHLSTDIFSPGSGKKDFVTIYHDNPTKGNEWSGFIFNEAGNKVRTFTWKDAPPKEISWDGKNDESRLLPDGVYYYQAASTDKAGNSFESEKFDLKSLSQFKNHTRIFTKDTPVSVSASLESFNPDSKDVKFNHQIFEIRSNVAKENKVGEWKLEIKDSKNTVVYYTGNKGDLIQFVEWNGKAANTKNTPDGIYTAALTVNFEAGTSSKAESREFSIDTIPPSLNTHLSTNIFSPGSGKKDFVTIFHENPTKEIEWSGYIFDESGNKVSTLTWKDIPPKEINWDGKNDNGRQVPDGAYFYQAASADKAGNGFESEKFDLKTLTQFKNHTRIFTKDTPVSVSASLESFNPDSKEARFNHQTFELKSNTFKENKVSNWMLEIRDSKNNVVYNTMNKGDLMQSAEWNGKTANSKNVPDGLYTAALTVNYDAGTSSRAESKEFSVDTIPPLLSAHISTDIFSPGSGRKDFVTIYHDNSTKENEWLGIIFDESGNTVKTYTWKDMPPKEINWDGKDNNNRLLPDGVYYYQAAAIDKAGNSFESEKFDLKSLSKFKNHTRIFTKETPVYVTASLESFNPDSKEAKYSKELFELKADTSKENKVENWTFEVKDKNNKTVYSLTKKGELPQTIEWNGKTNEKVTAPDESYYGFLTIDFAAGTSSKGNSKSFTIDTIPPLIEIKASSPVFSPNGDGYLDNFEIEQKSSAEEIWTETITDPSGNNVFTKYYKGNPPKKEIWDGRDQNGNIEKNGNYKYLIQSIDMAGNFGKAEVTVELKNVYTSAYMTISDDKFSPNGDGRFDTITFKPVINTLDDLEKYTIEILDQNKKVIKTFMGEKTVPESIIWDGMTDENVAAKDGDYTAKLTGFYRFGNKPAFETGRIILDTAPPYVMVTTSPKYFSPDNDGVNDELHIKFEAKARTGINNWKLSILTPSGKNDFMTWNGSGQPASEIIWDGKNTFGDLVESAEDYPVKIFAEDNVGNRIEKILDPIKVDILVWKLPDGRLKIRISSILFKADSAEMIDTPKNTEIINLLSTKLMKFNGYKIFIEGHVNPFISVNYIEKIGQQLSEDRAKVIAEILKSKGINAVRITTIGKGGNEPIVFPSDKQASRDVDYLQKNRRADFYLNK